MKKENKFLFYVKIFLGKLCDVQQEKTSAPAQSCPLKCGLGSCFIPRRGRLRGIAKCQCPLTWSGENCQTSKFLELLLDIKGTVVKNN